MLEKPLGHTRERIPAIGQGLTVTGGQATAAPAADSRRIRSIQVGLDLGLTYVDTAELYGGGHSEEIVGQAIAGRRDKVFLATKFRPQNATPEKLRAALEASLRRLGTDYVDLYQMHWPSLDVPWEDTFETLSELKEEGKIRFVGVSNFTSTLFAGARRSSPVELVSNQVEYNLVDRSAEVQWIPFGLKERVTTIAYSPFNSGRPCAGRPQQIQLQAIAARHGATLHQLILAWLIAQPGVVAVARAARESHVRENAQATCFRLSEAEMTEIDLATRQGVVTVPADTISVRGDPRGYGNEIEASRNDGDLDPPPESLAALIRQGYSKPVQLAPCRNIGGPRFELVSGNLLYWGYVLAGGPQVEIPAYIVSDSDSVASNPH